MRSLAGLGGFRRRWRSRLRTAVIVLVVLALAELQTVRTSDDLTTIFLLDRSQSIPQQWQGRMLQYINAANRTQKRPDDLSGVVVFGADARVESPPTRNPGPMATIENPVNGENTDLAAAIKLALASFPEDTARRLVILSDGNENRGEAIEQAIAAKGLDVQIDVLPIEYRYDQEVLVEKVSVPPDVKQGETVNINVVIRASEPTVRRLADLPANRRRPGADRRRRAPARRAAAGRQRPDAQEDDRAGELLHVLRRVHPRRRQRRPAVHQQHGLRLHPRPRQGERPADRGHRRRARRAGPGICASARSR